MAAENQVAVSQTDREIVITRLINAPPEVVFDAWTDPEQVGIWWGPQGFRTTTTEISVKPGGQWRFLMHGPDGTDYPNVIRYDEVVRPKRIVYRQSGEGDFENVQFHSEVTFEPEGSATRITLRSVFVSAEVCKHVVENYGAIEGGIQHLERLSDHVAHRTPETFTLSREFAAPRGLAYKVWTEPSHIEKWFGPKGFKVRVLRANMEPGGVLLTHMVGPNGIVIHGRWELRDLSPPERFTFVNSFADENGNIARHPMADGWPLEMLTTVSFTERDGRTTVTIQSSPINAPAAERAVFLDGHTSMRGGWGGTFEQLGDYLASLS